MPGTMSTSLARNISQRKKDEQKIRIRDHALQSSINSVCLTDLQGSLFYVNPAFVYKTGHTSPEEVLGRNIRELAQDTHRADEIFAILQKHGSWTCIP